MLDNKQTTTIKRDVTNNNEKMDNNIQPKENEINYNAFMDIIDEDSNTFPKLNTDNFLTIEINGELKTFNTPESNLKRANEIFQIFKGIKDDSSKSDKEKFDMISKILEICEINPEYNYYFLKYHPKCNDKDKAEFNEEKQILNWTLCDNDFFELNKESQINPAHDIFELLSLCDNEEKFNEKSEKIIYHNYNIPLIKAEEKFRLNLYRHRIANFDLFERNKINIYYKDLINNMKPIITSINPNQKNMDFKLYLFLLGLNHINNLKSKKWFELYFLQFLKPLEQLQDFENINNNYLYLDKISDSKILVKDINKGELIISNQFESIQFNYKNYVIQNLIQEFAYNIDIPLNIILQRNESFEFFCNKKTLIINDEEIYSDFKEYFISFIHSPLVREALGKNHKNIINAIQSNCFPGLFLAEDYVKAFPLYDPITQGYTDKDLLISFITYYPIIIEEFGFIVNQEQYNNIKNVFFLFDVCYKFIICLHEIIIHLVSGYLNYVSEGKITSKSPRSSKNSKSLKDDYDDGGNFFEVLLFGSEVKRIDLQLIYILLNGECFNKSLKEFRESLLLNFDPTNIKKTGLFGKILNKYPINFNIFQHSKVNGSMRRNNNFLFAKTGNVIGDTFLKIRPVREKRHYGRK